MEFFSNHQQVLGLIIQYKYYIIVPATLFEGPVVMLVSGFLVKLGYLSLIPAYIFLMIGDFLGDILWYCVGYFFGEKFVRKYGKYVSVSEQNIESVKRLFNKYHTSILLISKLTMGFGFAIVTLITAGLVKIPFRKYVVLNAVGEFIWTAILMSVGFGLGKFYLTIDSILGKIVTVASFIIIVLCIFGFGKYIKNRTIEKTSSL